MSSVTVVHNKCDVFVKSLVYGAPPPTIMPDVVACFTDMATRGMCQVGERARASEPERRLNADRCSSKAVVTWIGVEASKRRVGKQPM